MLMKNKPCSRDERILLSNQCLRIFNKFNAIIEQKQSALVKLSERSIKRKIDQTVIPESAQAPIHSTIHNPDIPQNLATTPDSALETLDTPAFDPTSIKKSVEAKLEKIIDTSAVSTASTSIHDRYINTNDGKASQPELDSQVGAIDSKVSITHVVPQNVLQNTIKQENEHSALNYDLNANLSINVQNEGKVVDIWDLEYTDPDSTVRNSSDTSGLQAGQKSGIKLNSQVPAKRKISNTYNSKTKQSKVEEFVDNKDRNLKAFKISSKDDSDLKSSNTFEKNRVQLLGDKASTSSGFSVFNSKKIKYNWDSPSVKADLTALSSVSNESNIPKNVSLEKKVDTIQSSNGSDSDFSNENEILSKSTQLIDTEKFVKPTLATFIDELPKTLLPLEYISSNKAADNHAAQLDTPQLLAETENKCSKSDRNDSVDLDMEDIRQNKTEKIQQVNESSEKDSSISQASLIYSSTSSTSNEARASEKLKLDDNEVEMNVKGDMDIGIYSDMDMNTSSDNNPTEYELRPKTESILANNIEQQAVPISTEIFTETSRLAINEVTEEEYLKNHESDSITSIDKEAGNTNEHTVDCGIETKNSTSSHLEPTDLVHNFLVDTAVEISPESFQVAPKELIVPTDPEVRLGEVSIGISDAKSLFAYEDEQRENGTKLASKINFIDTLNQLDTQNDITKNNNLGKEPNINTEASTYLGSCDNSKVILGHKQTTIISESTDINIEHSERTTTTQSIDLTSDETNLETSFADKLKPISTPEHNKEQNASPLSKGSIIENDKDIVDSRKSNRSIAGDNLIINITDSEPEVTSPISNDDDSNDGKQPKEVPFELQYAYYKLKERYPNRTLPDITKFFHVRLEPKLSRMQIKKTFKAGRKNLDINEVKTKLAAKYSKSKYELIERFLVEWVLIRSAEFGHLENTNKLKPDAESNEKAGPNLTDKTQSTEDTNNKSPGTKNSKKSPKKLDKSQNSSCSVDFKRVTKYVLPKIFAKYWEKNTESKAELTYKHKLFLIYLQTKHNFSVWNRSVVVNYSTGVTVTVFYDLAQLSSRINGIMGTLPPDLFFSVCESGLFYRLSFDTEQAKEQTSGNNENKERLSLILCSNATGSYKAAPWVVGNKIATPQWTSHAYKSENVVYRYQPKSQVAAYIFLEWLRLFDDQMGIFLKNYNAEIGNSNIPAQKGYDKVYLILRLDYVHSFTFANDLKHINILVVTDNAPKGILPFEAGISRLFRIFYKSSTLGSLIEASAEHKTASSYSPVKQEDQESISRCQSSTSVLTSVSDDNTVCRKPHMNLIQTDNSKSVCIPEEFVTKFMNKMKFKSAISKISEIWYNEITKEYIHGCFGLFATHVSWAGFGSTKTISSARQIESKALMVVALLLKQLELPNLMSLNQLLKVPKEQNVTRKQDSFKPYDDTNHLSDFSSLDEAPIFKFFNGKSYRYNISCDFEVLDEFVQILNAKEKVKRV